MMDGRVDEPEHRTRPRSNTNSFAAFGWRRPSTAPATATSATPSKAPSIEALIESLTPPSVPSLSYARSLSALLPSASPCPSLHVLIPILASLCAQDSPSTLQAAGFEILAAYCSNSASTSLTSTDVLACFSLFQCPWSSDTWEYRSRAFIAFFEVIPHKEKFKYDMLHLVKFWIKSAYDPLLTPYPLTHTESAERQRSLDDYFTLLVSFFHNSDATTYPLDDQVEDVLKFLGNMLHLALLMPADHNLSPIYPAPVQPPTDQSPRRFPHRRNQSSASIPILSPPASIRHPADIATDAYLLYLSGQLKHMSYVHLDSILPLLFRALAFYLSPLPRLSLNPLPEHHSHAERKICSVLDSLFGGSHSTSCSKILKHHLFPVFREDINPLSSLQFSLGAYRVLHNFMRRSLLTRLARAYIARASSISYTPSGAPGQIDLPSDVIQLAWPKEDLTSWELSKISRVLCNSVADWVRWQPDDATLQHAPMRDLILTEAAGMANDILQTFDDRADDDDLDEEETAAVGNILLELVSYIRLWQNPDGSPFIIPRSHPTDVNSPLLRTLSFMLSRDLTLPINTFIPNVLLSVADNLSDFDTSQAVIAMAQCHSFSPTSPQWLDNWLSVLSNYSLHAPSKPMTRRRIMEVLHDVHASIKDIPTYRMSLVQLVFGHCKQRRVMEILGDETDVVWLILGDEVVYRVTENFSQPSVEVDHFVEEALTFLTTTASSVLGRGEDEMMLSELQHTLTQTTPLSTGILAGSITPMPSRVQSDPRGQYRDRDDAMPSVMSLLTSLAIGSSSRSQSQQPKQADDDIPSDTSTPPSDDTLPLTEELGAVISLVLIFSRLVFTPHIVSDSNLRLAIRVYDALVNTLTTSTCIRARLTVLQFLMRLRAERDHKVYYASEDHDREGHAKSLAALINRLYSSPSQSPCDRDERVDEDNEHRRSRARLSDPNISRGRGAGGPRNPSRSTSGRSRSRVPGNIYNSLKGTPAKLCPLWQIPESLPFTLPVVDCTSDSLASYDLAVPDQKIILPLSSYLAALIDVLEGTKDWDILSYILCHLPVQLANKHLFCGPKCRSLMVRLLKVICGGISHGQLATNIEQWPEGLRARDAQGLAYHSLSILVSYKHCFDGQLLHALVEVLLDGLNGQPSTVKCCLQALSLAAFELRPSMRKYLPKILEKLSQIISNPAMAVHIIHFLSIVGSIQSLHANFTDADFKMVFGVALQYLQHHNRPDSSPTISWALSQHVRVMAYYMVYVWFLAVRLSDRHRHIPFIVRQLLLANEGKEKVDQPTEVCFDWLARYTYASADPRPANSFLNETVMNPRHQVDSVVSEKTWIVGNSVVTIRALSRLGWMEVLSRRASGLTKFLCRAENVPMVSPGDVNPDMLSLPASLMMDRAAQTIATASSQSEMVVTESFSAGEVETDHESRPDPITGYIWSGSAPSQRRKDVAIDPSFFHLQLSPYPDYNFPSRCVLVKDISQLKSFVRTLDRMPVIDTHKVGIMYVAPGQTHESEILRNTYGSPAYTRFLEGIGRLINLRGQMDVYAGGLDPEEDGEYAYAWWDDNCQILYHTATLMPTIVHDEPCNNKKRHIGNDLVRIIWNDSGRPYRFDTLATQFQFVNIVIEPHSRGAVAAFSDNVHENEYFKVTVQRAHGMTDFTPIGDFRVISADNLPSLVRQLSLLSDWFAFIFQTTENDTQQIEVITNWRARLDTIQRFKAKMFITDSPVEAEGGAIINQQSFRDFSAFF